ncbi:hypothetical protein LCGC14_1040150 [marine sediment metagenome]|uniref:Uncharacterized protein n=1 Tax=marine sediment metagenome TaxID=412755 RepID=A0A0F9QLC1_9ZZZZ
MSAGNFFETQRKAYDIRTVSLATATGAITYTARVGGTSDNFIHDRVIRVTTTSTFSMTITVPDGTYYGQLLLVIFEVEASNETVNVTTTTGDNATQMTAAGGYSELQWQGSTLGWVELSNEAT